jgi:transposase-like protein
MPKSYYPDEKIDIILRVLKGKKISDLVDEYGVGRKSIYICKNEFLDGGMAS